MIALSKNESKVLGVRVARGMLSESWQPSSLLQKIIELDVDFVRVKVPSTDEHVFEKLDRLGFDHTLYSILVRNSVDLLNDHEENALSPELTFELFDGRDPDKMMDLVRRSWGERTAVNYYNANFKHWVNYDTEKEGSAVYALEFDYTKNPNKLNWLIWKGDDLVGFVLGDVEGDHFEGIMYSVLPEFRGLNIARNIMIFLKKYCREKGLRYFKNDVVFQNMSSLKSIVTKAIEPVDTYLNITISSLLNASRTEVEQQKIGPLPIAKVQHWVFDNLGQFVTNNGTLSNICFNNIGEPSEIIDNVVISTPLIDDIHTKVLLKFGQGNVVKTLAYITYRYL